MVSLFILGTIFLGLGIHVRLGGFKSLYLAKGVPILMPRALQNGFIPIGAMLIAMVVALSETLFPEIETRQVIFLWLLMPLFFSSLIIVAWAPRWVRPRWIVYLEDEYGTVMWHLLEEAAKDARNWENRIKTQEGLEEWAEETRERLGYPPHSGQIERDAKSKRRF